MLIYCIYNTVNGKSYVGQTRQTLAARWKSHRAEALKRNSPRYLCRAIRKYGISSFEVFPLAQAATFEQLEVLERLWIMFLQTMNPALGYNRKDGGGALSPAAAKQMAATKRGRSLPEWHKEKIRKACTGLRWTAEARANWKGCKKSKATREKMRGAALKREAIKRGKRNGTDS